MPEVGAKMPSQITNNNAVYLKFCDISNKEKKVQFNSIYYDSERLFSHQSQLSKISGLTSLPLTTESKSGNQTIYSKYTNL